MLVEVDQQRDNADAARTAAQQRVAKLKARKARLVEVYVYESGIDQETYQEQLARITGELDAAEVDHQEAVFADMDVDGTGLWSCQGSRRHVWCRRRDSNPQALSGGGF